MNTTTTARCTMVTNIGWSDARRLRRRLGVAVLTAALLSSTACGVDAPFDEAGVAAASTTSASTTSTTEERPTARQSPDDGGDLAP